MIIRLCNKMEKYWLVTTALSLFINFPMTAMQYFPNTGLTLQDYIIKELFGSSSG